MRSAARRPRTLRRNILCRYCIDINALSTVDARHLREQAALARGASTATSSVARTAINKRCHPWNANATRMRSGWPPGTERDDHFKMALVRGFTIDSHDSVGGYPKYQRYREYGFTVLRARQRFLQLAVHLFTRWQISYWATRGLYFRCNEHLGAAYRLQNFYMCATRVIKTPQASSHRT